MKDLIQAAKEVIDAHRSEAHKVGAVLRSKDGRLFKSVSVQGQKMHLCSEWSALTQALMSGVQIEMIVAVYKSPEGDYEIYSPCGLCRELFLTHCPDAQVIIAEDKVVVARDLLPNAWTR